MYVCVPGRSGNGEKTNIEWRFVTFCLKLISSFCKQTDVGSIFQAKAWISVSLYDYELRSVLDKVNISILTQIIIIIVS